MTLLDYLLLGGFVAAAGYVVGRLFLGWLATNDTSQVDRATAKEGTPDRASKAVRLAGVEAGERYE